MNPKPLSVINLYGNVQPPEQPQLKVTLDQQHSKKQEVLGVDLDLTEISGISGWPFNRNKNIHRIWLWTCQPPRLLPTNQNRGREFTEKTARTLCPRQTARVPVPVTKIIVLPPINLPTPIKILLHGNRPKLLQKMTIMAEMEIVLLLHQQLSMYPRKFLQFKPDCKENPHQENN